MFFYDRDSDRWALMQVRQITGISSRVPLMRCNLTDYRGVVLAARLSEELPLRLLLQDLLERHVRVDALELGVVFEHFSCNSGGQLFFNSAGCVADNS